MLSVYRKEMRSYLDEPHPLRARHHLHGFMTWWFFFLGDFFLYRQARMEHFFGVLPWVFIFLVPAISMRLWSEESRGGTLETLLTLPVRSWQIVVGKFLARGRCSLFCLLATLADPDHGRRRSATSTGGPSSAGTWAPCCSAARCLAHGGVDLGPDGPPDRRVPRRRRALVRPRDPRARRERRSAATWASVFEQLSVAARYDSLGRGVVDLRDVLYFVSFTGFFLYLNTLDGREPEVPVVMLSRNQNILSLSRLSAILLLVVLVLLNVAAAAPARASTSRRTGSTPSPTPRSACCPRSRTRRSIRVFWHNVPGSRPRPSAATSTSLLVEMKAVAEGQARRPLGRPRERGRQAGGRGRRRPGHLPVPVPQGGRGPRDGGLRSLVIEVGDEKEPVPPARSTMGRSSSTRSSAVSSA